METAHQLAISADGAPLVNIGLAPSSAEPRLKKGKEPMFAADMSGAAAIDLIRRLMRHKELTIGVGTGKHTAQFNVSTHYSDVLKKQVTACLYAIARQAGVPIGKADFDGYHKYPLGFSFTDEGDPRDAEK